MSSGWDQIDLKLWMKTMQDEFRDLHARLDTIEASRKVQSPRRKTTDREDEGNSGRKGRGVTKHSNFDLSKVKVESDCGVDFLSIDFGENRGLSAIGEFDCGKTDLWMLNGGRKTEATPIESHDEVNIVLASPHYPSSDGKISCKGTELKDALTEVIESKGSNEGEMLPLVDDSEEEVEKPMQGELLLLPRALSVPSEDNFDAVDASESTETENQKGAETFQLCLKRKHEEAEEFMEEGVDFGSSKRVKVSAIRDWPRFTNVGEELKPPDDGCEKNHGAIPTQELHAYFLKSHEDSRANLFEEGESDTILIPQAKSPSTQVEPTRGIGGPIPQSRTKRLKEALQGLIYEVQDKGKASPRIEGEAKWLTWLRIQEERPD